MLPVHAQLLGASLAMVGLIVGAYGIAQLVLRVPMGMLSDRIGARRPFVIAGLAAAGVGALTMGFAADPWALLAGRALSGVSAATWVIFTVLFAASFAPGASARAMALISAITSLAQLVSTSSGGLIAEGFGFQAPFLVGAALSALGIAVVLPLVEPPRRRSGARPLRVTAGPLLAVAAVQGALLVGASQAAAYGYGPIYATAMLRASPAELGALTAALFLASTLAALASAYAASRLGARWMIMLGAVAAAFGLLLVPFAVSIPGMALLMALHGVGRGTTQPLLMTVSIAGVPDESRAGAMGVFQAGYSIGMVAAPPIAGLLADALGLSSVFYACGFACLVAASLSLLSPLWRAVSPAGGGAARSAPRSSRAQA